MVAPLIAASVPYIAAHAPYLTALGYQASRYWPNITRFGGQAAAHANNLFRTISSGTQRLGQLMYSPPISQSLIQQGPLLAPFLGAGVESFMMNSPKPPSPPPSQESPIPSPYPAPETFTNKKFPEDLNPKVDVPQAQPLALASQTSPREPTDAEKFLQSNTYKFFQSDAYQKLKDIFAGMAESSSDGSGWDALASGVKRLNEGDKQRGQVNQTVEYLKSKGYSEEEAQLMAGNKDALNAFLAQKISGGNRKPQITNDGRMLMEDPNAPGGYRYIMVEGGKAYEDAERAKTLHENNIVRKSILLKDIGYLDEYIKKKGGYASGLIAWLKSIIPGSQEQGADQVVKSIKERIANDRIDELKQLSSTGAVGLGNVSNKDLDMLKHSLGSLSISMNIELFTRNLDQIRDVISRLSPEAKAYLLGEDASHSSANQSMSQGGSANLPTISRREDIKKLAIGEKVSILDGNYIYDIIKDR